MSRRMTILLSSLGAGLEYYDFMIYALLAQYISSQFFPSHDHHTSLIAAYGVFAMGYIIRPAGGLIFGIFSDKYGRKKIFVFIMLLMSFSTLGMGVLPNYDQIGLAAPLFFVSFRLLQGISFGAELPGAITFIAEHASKKHRGLYLSIMVSFVTTGMLLASFISWIVTKLFSPEDMFLTGWRIPFIIGAFLALVALKIRLHTTETSYFQHKKETTVSLFSSFIYSSRKIILGIAIIILPSSLVMLFMCLPSFLHDIYHFESTEIYLSITLGYAWCCISTPIFGFIGDRIGRKIVFLLATAFFLLAVLLIYYIPFRSGFFSLLIFMLFYQTILSAIVSCIYPVLSEIFPTRIRFTGAALCYNVTYLIASFVPVIINSLYKITGNTSPIFIFLFFLGSFSFISGFYIQDRTGMFLKK